jgi:uncharacterized protein
VFFSVKELELRKARFDVALPPGEIEFYQGLRQVTPLEATGTAELLGNTLGEIRVKGHLKVEMEAECDRCLEAARFPVDANFDLFYRPAPEARSNQHEEVAIDPGESEIAFYEGGGLELNEILREHIVLTLPMQRICSDVCKGICPVCGVNRNQQECHCELKPVDDRWSALKELRRN